MEEDKMTRKVAIAFVVLLALTSVLSTGNGTSVAQSGRKKAEAAKQPGAGTTAPGAPPGIDESKPVLVTMSPDEFEVCGLKKLSPEELQKLDGWIFRLLVNTTVSPSGELVPNRPSESGQTAQRAELEKQQLESQLRDLHARLAEIRHSAAQMINDLRNVHFALQRRDTVLAQTYLFSVENAANRIQRAAQ
jgi:hypothetical protein